jgi:methyl acetate hydrolase
MSRFAAIDGLLAQAADADAVPGVVALVTGPDGVLYEGAAGEATPDTMFRFASMTKAMATVAALALVEEGRLELDQPVASILPEFGEL